MQEVIFTSSQIIRCLS